MTTIRKPGTEVRAAASKVAPAPQAVNEACKPNAVDGMAGDSLKLSGPEPAKPASPAAEPRAASKPLKLFGQVVGGAAGAAGGLLLGVAGAFLCMGTPLAFLITPLQVGGLLGGAILGQFAGGKVGTAIGKNAH